MYIKKIPFFANGIHKIKNMNLKEIIKTPSTLSLITTYKCTAKCPNCCFQCNPQRKEQMGIKEMMTYIKEAKESYPQLKILVLTGGECMIYNNSIVDVINYASKKHNLLVRIVTNGFWATSFEYSLEILQCLVDAGLNEINFSTGDEHQLFIPIENIRNGILASAKIELKPLVNIESNDYKNFTSKYFTEDKTMLNLIRKNKLDIIKWYMDTL